MNIHDKIQLLSIVLMTVLTISVPAQDLPALKQAPELQTGTFPNGISYMIVNNKAASGCADFTLVQKYASDPGLARESLNSLPHFREQKPYEFLSSKGVGYTSEGYYSTDGRAGIFRFRNVPTSDAAASDSTLMLIFDLCATNPYEQAVIISGDVDAATLKGKMSIFSMTVPTREPAPAFPKYEWKPSSDVGFTAVSNHFDNLCSITVSYNAPRTPDKLLKTIQSLVTERMYAELGIILKRRLSVAFASAGIPLAGVDAVYRDSSCGYGDESFSVTIHVGKEDLIRSVAAMAKVIANLDKAGVVPAELVDARDEHLAGLSKIRQFRSDSEYTDLCIASYLHGNVVRTLSAEYELFSKKQLPAEMDTELFNKFVANLFDSYENLSLSLSTPYEKISRDKVLDAYMLPWSKSIEAGERQAYVARASDTLKLADAGGKVKLKAEIADPLTGGSLWTFSNGIRVIYKNAPTPGQFRYCFMVRGGYGTAGALSPGEGAFVSDMMEHFDVAGMKSADFNAMLRANGISMSRKVGVSDLRIEGTAPSSRLSLVVKSVVSFVNHHRFNDESYENYLKAENLRLELAQAGKDGVLPVVDSVLRPEFALTPYKMSEHIPSDLPAKMTGYLATQAHKMNDGVIIIVGDLPSEQVLKLFTKYAGSFMTSGIQAQRPHAQYQLHSSIGTTGRVRGPQAKPIATIAMAANIPVTKERYMTFGLAKQYIEAELAARLGRYGLSAELTSVVEFSPVESFCLVVTVSPVSENGLPAGMAAPDAQTSLGILRDALSDIMTSQVPAKDFKRSLSVFQKQADFEMARPAYMSDAAALRYSEGKDLVSTYKETIKVLTGDMLNDLLATLWNGAKVEYMTGK